MPCFLHSPNLEEKRFYTRGTLSIEYRGFHDWLKSLFFIVIDWDPWIKKMVNYLSFIIGTGGLKDFHCSAQNAALFVDLL